MKAVILAGGLGKRLRSIVADRPKPMVEIDSKPFLEYQIDFIKKFEIKELILCVGHLHEWIMEYFGNGRSRGIDIKYSIEKEPLGTAGALKNAESYLKGPFLMLNGDSYFDVNLTRLLRFHLKKKMDGSNCLGTILLTRTESTKDYGTVELGADNEILTFAEKAENKNGSSGLVNAGIYVLESELLKLISANKKTSLEQEIFPLAISQNHPLYGLQSDGFFVDIGTPEGYRTFMNHLRKGTQ